MTAAERAAKAAMRRIDRARAIRRGAFAGAEAGVRQGDEDIPGSLALANDGDEVPARRAGHGRETEHAPAVRAQGGGEKIEPEGRRECEDGRDPPLRRDQLGEQPGGASCPRRRQNEARQLWHRSESEGEGGPAGADVPEQGMPSGLAGRDPEEPGPEHSPDRQKHCHDQPQDPPGTPQTTTAPVIVSPLAVSRSPPSFTGCPI